MPTCRHCGDVISCFEQHENAGSCPRCTIFNTREGQAMKAKYKGGHTGGSIKCKACGSGNTYEQILPDDKGAYLSRITCLDCHAAHADQIGPYPTQRKDYDGNR